MWKIAFECAHMLGVLCVSYAQYIQICFANSILPKYRFLLEALVTFQFSAHMYFVILLKFYLGMLVCCCLNKIKVQTSICHSCRSLYSPLSFAIQCTSSRFERIWLVCVCVLFILYSFHFIDPLKSPLNC